MKTITRIFFLIIGIYSFAQNDTININETIPIDLIFPEIIESINISSDKFCITYQKKENILTLEAIKDKSDFLTSTLLIKTLDKMYYKFILEYSDNTIQNTFFIRLENSLNHSKEKYLLNYEGDKEETRQNSKQILSKENVKSSPIYSKEIKAIFDDKYVLKKASQKKDKVKFQLCNNYYKDNKSYYKIYVKNNAFLDYKIKYFKLKIETKKDKTNKSSVTKEFKEKDFKIYGDLNKTIKNKDKAYFIIELDKLVVHENEFFTIEVKEDLGNRDFKFYVPNYLVNDPYPIKYK